MNQKYKTSQNLVNNTRRKVIGVGGVAITLAVMMFGCASSRVTEHSNVVGADAFTPSGAVDASISAESSALYHYLMGQVAGIHSGLAEQQGDQDKGIALINIAIPNLVQANEYLNDAKLAEQTAKTALFAKRYEDAQKSVQRWVRLQPLRSKPYQLAAVVEMAQKNYESAAVYLNQVIGVDNSPEQGEKTVLALLNTVKNPDDVIGVADALALQRPSSAMPALASARAWLAKGAYERALPYLDEVLAKDAGVIEAILLKADVLERTESIDVAVRFLSHQLELQPSNTVLRGAYAEFLSQSEQYAKASEQYIQLLSNDKKDALSDAPVLMRLAQISLQQNQGDKAVVYLKRILNLDNKDEHHARMLPNVYYRLGMAYEMQKNWPQAMDAYQSLQSLKASDAWLKDTTLVRMVVVDLQQKKFKQAKVNLDKLGVAVKSWQAQSKQQSLSESYAESENLVKQLSIEWHQLKTEWYTRQNDHNNAYVSINQGLDAYPNSFDLRYTRSLVAERLGHIEQAVSDLEALLKQRPDSPDVKNALGYTLANKTQQYERAHALIKEALDELPNSYAVMDSMGWVLFKQGKLSEAESYLRQAYEQSKDAEVSAHLFEVLWVQNKQSQAMQVLHRALSENPNNAVLNEAKNRLVD